MIYYLGNFGKPSLVLGLRSHEVNPFGADRQVVLSLGEGFLLFKKRRIDG